MRSRLKKLAALLTSAVMVLPFFTEYPEGTFDLDWSVSAAEALTDDTTGVTLSDSDSDGVTTISAQQMSFMHLQIL